MIENYWHLGSQFSRCCALWLQKLFVHRPGDCHPTSPVFDWLLLRSWSQWGAIILPEIRAGVFFPIARSAWVAGFHPGPAGSCVNKHCNAVVIGVVSGSDRHLCEQHSFVDKVGSVNFRVTTMPVLALEFTFWTLLSWPNASSAWWSVKSILTLL